MDVPPNPTPDPVQSVFDLVTGLFSTYGWTILFFVIILNLLWSHFYPKYRKWQEKQEELQNEAELKRDPTYIIERDAALARSRQKMQEEHEKLTEERLAKIKEREEKKKQEKIQALENLIYGKSKQGPSNDSESFRPAYNPLTGTGGRSSGFRPSRRLGGGGGGG